MGVIFLAVKPHIFPEVLKKLKESLSSENVLTNESKLFISIMAGIKVETLTTSLKSIVQSPRIIRATVNTPARVSQGCFVYSLSKESLPEDSELIKQLLSSVGLCEQIS